MSPSQRTFPEVPQQRVRRANDAPVKACGDYVLYWMTASRRLSWNFALDRAIAWAHELGKPLLILEALRLDYPWASERLHAFILEGMRDNSRRAQHSSAFYYPYVEKELGAGRGLLEALSARAAVVVTDDFPGFFLPQMVATASRRLSVRLECIDSNGLLPLAATQRLFTRAYDFRRFLQRELLGPLEAAPQADPLADAPIDRLATAPLEDVERRWRPLSAADLDEPRRWLGELRLDHGVKPAATVGGSTAAERRWRSFLEGGLEGYGQHRNEPDRDGSSRLSPYLHFGHLSVHQVFADIAERQRWTPLSVATTAQGQRQGFWGMAPSTEAFLDQLITWRELGFNMTSKSDTYDRLESLPEWAQRTIDEHRADPRPWCYRLDDFEKARTHDELWNAAQQQLLQEGTIHNYLRMLWGKKIYEWSAEPEEALGIMIHLNNKYALDGRDPNSYSGIFWCLGRYDRPWGPERPVFGKLRTMTSRNTRRKLKLDRYLLRYGVGAAGQAQLPLDV